MSQVLIPPTVGRVVWFYPSLLTGEAGFASPKGDAPLAAIVAHVWSDTMVNLAVFDANGASHARTSVRMIHEEQTGDRPSEAFCAWMPFQKGQARAQAAVQAAESDSAAAACGLKALDAQAKAPVTMAALIKEQWDNSAVMSSVKPRLGRRDALEYELVAGAARVLAEHPSSAKVLAEGIEAFLNVLHPVAAPPNPQASLLYDAIRNAMEELGALHPGFNDHVNRAWNHLHRAFWSEVPAPASAPVLRDTLAPEETRFDLSPIKQQIVGRQSCEEPAVPAAHFDFGEAIRQLKAGVRVARAGWNGKGQFVYLVPPASYAVQTGAAKAHFGEGSMVPYNAYLALKTVDETVSTWAPSVSDCLAEDWAAVPA